MIRNGENERSVSLMDKEHYWLSAMILVGLVCAFFGNYILSVWSLGCALIQSYSLYRKSKIDELVKEAGELDE